MVKYDIVKKISENVDLTCKDIEIVVNELTAQIMDAVASGEKVIFKHFGVWEPRKRKSRLGVNPKTCRRIDIPAKTVPTFHAGKLFCEKVNAKTE